MRVSRDRVRTNIALIGVLALLFSAAMLYAGRMASADVLSTKIWDGGGATNNWSEAGNWSGDVVPAAGDNVTFDATSTKNATIDVNIDVGSIQISSGYTGAVTQSNAASIQVNGCSGRICFRQEGGTFNGSTNTVTVNSSGFGAFTLTGGIFNGGSGDILMNGSGADLSLQGGTFTSTSGNLSFPGILRFQGNSVFNHNNGTVTVNSTQNQFFGGDSNHQSITFNNLNYSAGNGVNYDFGLRIIVVGSLVLNDGQFGAGNNGSTIEARGPISISPNYDGGMGTVEIANGTGSRTFAITAQQILPRIFINDPNVTVNAAGSGTVTFPRGFVLSQGILNQNSVDLQFGPPVGGGFCYTQNGGIFNGSGNTITVNSNGFGAILMNGGSFNGGSGDILLAGASSQNPDLSMQGGTFRSTSGTLTSGGTIRAQGASTFLHNSGTVVLTANDSNRAIVGDSNHLSIIFNNLNFDLADRASFLIGSRPIVLGNLALDDGFLSQNGAVVEARGTYTLAPTFDGGNASLEFGPGASARTLILAAGLTYPKIVLNDPLLTVNTSGSGTLVLPHQLVINNGTFNQGGVDLSITALDVGGGSCLRMTGGAFNGSDHLLTLTANGFGAVFMTGGTFNGGSGNITATGPGAEITVNGALFKSTSGTLFAGRDFRMQSKTVFDPNGGTVVFDEGTNGGPIVSIVADNEQGAPIDISFNNVIVDKSNATILMDVRQMTVNGSLTLNDGAFDSVSGTTVDAFGNVNVASAFDGFSNDVILRFNGSACQVVSISGSQTFANDWVVNKTGCGITAVGDFGVHAISVPSGNFTFGAGTQAALAGNLTIDPNGRVTVGDDSVVNIGGDATVGGDLGIGGAAGSVEISGAINIGGGAGSVDIDGTDNHVATGSVDISGSGGDLDIGGDGNSLDTGAIDVSGSGGDLTIDIDGTNNTINAGNGQIGGMLDLSGLGNVLQFDSLTIDPAGRLTADSADTIILGGDVVNNGLVNLHAAAACEPSGPFLTIQSSSPGTQRNWSGPGVVRIVNAAVGDMAGSAPISVHGGVNQGNNGANWTFDNVCRAAALHAPFDFDGDGKTDLSVFRPSTGEWFAFRSTLSVVDQQFGLATDKLVPADYDGDGLTDIAVYRESTGQWMVLESSDHILQLFNWGINGDDPAPGDYDGDGKADITQFRASEGNWYILRSRDGNPIIVNWGQEGDSSIPGDFDGDNKTDEAIYRPSTGQWFVFGSSQGPTVAAWGINGDRPVVGDFDGDGKADLSVFRSSENNWYVYQSSDSGTSIVHWGEPGDSPVAGDFDGDGKFDQAMYRHGTWLINRSTTGPLIADWGVALDIPVPAAYLP